MKSLFESLLNRFSMMCVTVSTIITIPVKRECVIPRRTIEVCRVWLRYIQHTPAITPVNSVWRRIRTQQKVVSVSPYRTTLSYLAAVWVDPRKFNHVNRVTLYGNPPSLPSRVTLFQNGNLDSNPCNTHQIPNELFWVTHVR